MCRKVPVTRPPGSDAAPPGELSEQDAQAGLTLEYMHLLCGNFDIILHLFRRRPPHAPPSGT